ncbi:hypothetical protein Asi03nite_20200 [Actinoplanes siamensis]|uniref:Uncharacterized protein n=2 Tax=Actinoplanes siamensis TaxID=1223317 RepID=A0A919N558_9ACTN|nr:hypothetical protein Asi03nite_20200 [Actinoplanes siamensis]
MKKRVILYGIAAVLAGVVAADLISGGRLIRLPDGENETYRRFARINAELVRAGTARVTFTATMIPGGAWAGTSAVRFGETPVWDTSYDRATVGDGTAPMRRLHLDERTEYLSSPALRPADERAWIDPDVTSVTFGPISSPRTGVADVTTWLRFLGGVDRAHALQAKHDLPDVPGAPHEFLFRCFATVAQCPPPYETELDDAFNTSQATDLRVWLDDDGRLRRLGVFAVLDHLEADGSRDVRDLSHPIVASTVEATFDLRDFGIPVLVAAPPRAEVSTERYLKV